uniref:non-specific serine/threonine protein kinase n=1 Tax=Gryllus bimaculatus TaxID=6999 RepID=A0A455R5U5_GRYBI|nr:adaptor protein Pelle/IRAK [Gryllus bimaculatus]
MTSNGNGVDRYIYNLPYAQHQELCRILDRDMTWEELGGKYMNYDMSIILDLRRDDQRGKSPTSQLLTMWGQQNHTVLQLFVLLSKMHHYQAMTVLKPLVDPRYHDLIYEGEENVRFFDDEDGNSASDSPRQDQNANDGAANARALPQSHSSEDKNMNVWGDNLNRRDAPRDMGRDKMLLMPEQPERKIINKPMPLASSKNDSNEGNIRAPRMTVDAPSSDVPPVQSPPVPVQNMGAKQRREGKENNPTPQERKLSCASDVSTVAESIPLIPYLELESATQGWDKTTIIGKGGFGTVFKGNWKNTLVAIKKIEQRGAESAESHQAQMEQLLQELRILNSCRHDNILPLYGFSMDGTEPCLVYQFMPNGSLEDRLLCRQGTLPLSWIQRHNIARGTARGLQFLHVKPFIHGDIKSANILLDKNVEPRIGDFGLARDGPQGHYTHMKISRIHGTLAYLPIDFLRNKQLSTKVDTYSFGIVMFELATGLRAFDEKRPEKFLKDFIEKYPNNVLELSDKKPGLVNHLVFDYLMELAKRCVCSQARERPEMEEVLKNLEAHYCRLVERVHHPQPPRSPVPPIFVVRPDAHAAFMQVPGLPHVPPHCLRPAASPVPIPYLNAPQDGHISVPDGGPEDSHSSVESSEEVDGAVSNLPAVSSQSSPPSNAVLPLLSELGTKDSKESQEIPPSQVEPGSISRISPNRSSSVPSPKITAKGKRPLCGDLSH